MRKRVADYIADFLVNNGIDTIFTVVGGGAMHLNDAFGQKEGLNVYHNHHEQACAMAAEGYARQSGKIAAVCVTTGPGGTNAMTGVLGAYQDNVPMLIISGQVRYSVTVESTGLNLRQYGPQEYCIIDSVEPMTKYAYMIRRSDEIRYQLEKALYIAKTGNKGPVWLDVPLNIQGDVIETDGLAGYSVINKKINYVNICNNIIEKLRNAERPLILAGAGIRRLGVHEEFVELANKMSIPVLAPTCVSDVLPLTHKYYYQNFGAIGGRVGNFLVQNADVIFIVGTNLNLNDTSFNYESFSPKSYKIMVAAECDELRKPNVVVDYPIWADVGDIIKTLNSMECNIEEKNNWIRYANALKERFDLFDDVVERNNVNPYIFAKILMNQLPDDSTVVTGNSAGACMALHYGVPKEKQRLYSNIGCGSMGWDLPASLGAAIADKEKNVICLTGDGSIQMNLQELQTMVRYKIPLKIIIYSNGGYMGVVRTQKNFFNGRITGCTAESGLDFPKFERIAEAYGIPYRRIEKNSEIESKLKEFLDIDGYGICELIEDTEQGPAVKLTSRKLENGEIVSAPFDDLYPLLEKAEYEIYSNYNNF